MFLWIRECIQRSAVTEKVVSKPFYAARVITEEEVPKLETEKDVTEVSCRCRLPTCQITTFLSTRVDPIKS